MQVTANYQIKYGQIARIKKDLLYSVEIKKDPLIDDCIRFDIFVTKKSSKSRKEFKDDLEKQYGLDDGKNFDVLREIIKAVGIYLENYRPRYICLQAYWIEWLKRMNFYLKILSRFGYSAFDHYNREACPGDLLLTYTEDCKKIFIGAEFSEEKNDFYFYTKDGEKSFINWK
jgi:hypothetical protein